LRGDEPDDAVALMRSRYTAFATGDVEYLWRTLDAAHVDRAQPREEVLRSLRETCRRMRFLGLRILKHVPVDDHGIARVHFAVRAFEKGRDRSFQELSRFRHDGHGWRYLDGEPR
jgi:SEC-C motif-containing protein